MTDAPQTTPLDAFMNSRYAAGVIAGLINLATMLLLCFAPPAVAYTGFATLILLVFVICWLILRSSNTLQERGDAYMRIAFAHVRNEMPLPDHKDAP